ncbi:MAG: hypothetical protein AABW89_06025 [Nanoarchaeota archaeon]
MKIIIWLIVAIVLVGGLAWFLSSDTENINSLNEEKDTSQISEEGRVIDTDNAVLDEIDEVLSEIG